MNEWLAFGVVAVICGLLAGLVRFSGEDESSPPDSPTGEAPP
ncbi:MAG: hypothetical protein NT171_01045 [Planctomycetota bacterium]|nr:hypothetical protein [Planctomycetota bacterium]